MERGAVSVAPGLLDVLLIGVPAELILKLTGQNATCTLAETSRAAASSTRAARVAYRQRPRERGLARLFVLHNERPSEKERDHYAQWRAGWEPQLRETELRSWFPRGLLPRMYVRVDSLICDVDSGSDSDDEEPDEPTQWSCARCTLQNPPSQTACSACGDERPDMSTASARSPEDKPTSLAHEQSYSLAQFARWRGCDPQLFAGIHHGDLVMDEGQYRGHGTFVALWSSDSDPAASGEPHDPGQLLLTPSTGLNGVMLPKGAWSVVQTHGPEYYERAGYGSWLFAEIPVSDHELAEHEQMVLENDRAAAAAAAECEGDAHDLRLREHGARPSHNEVPAGEVPPLPSPGCDHVYCELRPATRLTQQVAPRPSDYRLALYGIKGDRRAAGAAGDPVWSNLSPREFSEIELSSSSDLRWRQQQPITSLLQPSVVQTADIDRSTAPTLWGAGQADTNSCGFPILTEDAVDRMAQPPAIGAAAPSNGYDDGSSGYGDGVLTEDMAYMMIAPSQQPIAATHARESPANAINGQQTHDSFVHDGMARLYNNHWQNRTTGEEDAAVSHDQWNPAFVPAPTPLPTPGKRQTNTYHSTDTVRHMHNCCSRVMCGSGSIIRPHTVYTSPRDHSHLLYRCLVLVLD
jgi:hypothetical protein